MGKKFKVPQESIGAVRHLQDMVSEKEREHLLNGLKMEESSHKGRMLSAELWDKLNEIIPELDRENFVYTFDPVNGEVEEQSERDEDDEGNSRPGIHLNRAAAVLLVIMYGLTGIAGTAIGILLTR